MITAVVYQESTLGLMGVCTDKSTIEVLGGIETLGGKTADDGPILYVHEKDYRLATREDFDVFNVDYNEDFNVSEDKDVDGFVLIDSVNEKQSSRRGMLEVVVYRGMGRVSRFFEGSKVGMANMYQQAIKNPNVLMYSII